MKEFLKRLSVIQWIIIALTIAVNIFIIVNSCLPAEESTQASRWIVDPLQNIINAIKPNTINGSNIDSFTHIVRKIIGHFFLFVISGLLTTVSIKFIDYDYEQKFFKFVIISSISGLFLAILTEFTQKFVPGRSGEAVDVLIDFSGYMLSTLIVCLIIYLTRNKTTKLENEN